jgi:hypothetical protein
MVSRSVALLGFLLAAPFVSLPALARWNVPVESVEHAPIVTASGKPIPPGVVRDAFIFAGKRYNWEFSGGPDQLIATTSWNNKHSISVDILYTADHYSIRYRDSKNMNYDPHNGEPVIHPEYNRRVKQLIDEFSNELRRY